MNRKEKGVQRKALQVLAPVLPTVDASLLASIREATQPLDVISEMIHAFSRQTPTLIAGIKIALEEENEHQIAYLVHKIKGSAGCMGLARLAHITEQMENYCHKQSPAGLLSDLIPVLEHEFEAGLAQLKRDWYCVESKIDPTV